MKTNSLFGKTLVAVTLLLIGGMSSAMAQLYTGQGDFNWGDASRFEVLTLGSGVEALNLSGPPSNQGIVTGNIGIAGTNSTFVMSGNTMVDGSVYLNTGDKFSLSQGTVSGAVLSNIAVDNTLLNSAATSAASIANLARAAAPTTPWSSSAFNLGKNSNVSLTSTGHFVMNLTNFTLGGGAILSLHGGAHSTFVFNITGDFDIGGGSKILLSGGLLASNVVFNLLGSTSTDRQVGGDSVFSGTILATTSKVTVSGHSTDINGQIIAKQVVLQSGADLSMSP